jgi:hypothetical protein
VTVTATPAISWVLLFAFVASIVALTATLALRKGYVEQLAVEPRFFWQHYQSVGAS